MSKVCDRVGCSNTFEPPVNNPHQKYCSTYCRHKAKRVRYADTLVDRVCPTCGQTYQTTELEFRNGKKNYCSDDCKPPVRYEEVEVTCQRCHIQFMAYPQTKWCEECRDEVAREYSRANWRRYYKRPTYGMRKCAHCNREFMPDHGAQIYHNKRCAERAHKNNEGAKKRQRKYMQRRNEWTRKPPGSERVYRARIFERDNWTCQLCGSKVDKRLKWPHPKSATIDHILPLANGGQHVPENCQLAHFICNSTRSNTGEAQLRLFA